MARSIGEAIATGADIGYRRVMDYADRRDEKARQAKLDEERQQTLADARQRQATQDQLSALDQQEKMLATEGQALADSATPDPVAQRDFSQRVATLRSAKGKLLSQTTGIDVSAARQAGMADLEALQKGDGDVTKLQPGQLSRATTVATGRNPRDFLREPGRPAAVEKAGMDVLEGLQAGDMGRVISGLNVLHGPELEKGVGGDSKHGKVVAKRIVNVVPAPGEHGDNPKVVPILRVYVNSGKDFRGPLPPDVPEGSTGYYDAPLTERRSSDPDDQVKAIGLDEAMDYIGKQLQMVELLNTPAARAKLQEDEQLARDWNPDEYLQALRQVGATKKSGVTIKDVAVPAGGSVLRTIQDERGKVVSTERIEGNPKTASSRPGTTQEKIDAIDALVADGTYTEAEGRERKRALGKTVSEGTRRAGGGGAGTGSNLQSTKVGADGFMIGVFRDGTTKRLMLDGKPIKAQDYAKRVDNLAKDIAKSIDGIGRSAADIRSEAEQTLIEKVEPAAEPPAPAPGAAKRLKFDRQGNLVK